ncbi:MAG: response regulator [Polyangiaceae bacterium]|nr:response regulator [Polyangiaceae bacterium]
MSSTTILLVEDNPLTRKLVRFALEREACTLLEATTGAEALALIETHRPELVIQDLILPDGSGFDLVKKLRLHASTAEIPILAFTGLLSKSDEARIWSAGFDGLVSKPIEPSRLLYLVRGHLPAKERDSRPFGVGKRLLVVDDDAQQLKLARFRLARLGFTVETASDGAEALEIARRFRPDAIVTDALMPRLDGFGLCIAVRKDPELSSVPVVLATSSYVEAEDKVLARQAGANAYVVRTADLAEVVRALDGILHERMTAAPARPATDSPETVESVRALRTVRQLERQVALNSGLIQRCSTLSAELSVLSTVADALVGARDIERALFDVLANCLDVAGASRGAIYLRQGDGSFALKAAHGFGDQAPLAESFGHSPMLARAVEQGSIMRIAEAGPDRESSQSPLGPNAVIVPLRTSTGVVGAMLLDAPRSGEMTDDWLAFAQAISNQVSLALSLATAFARMEASEVRTRALMENAEDGIFVTTECGRVLEVNRAGERLLATPARNIVGRPFSEFVPRSEAVRPDGSVVSVEYTSSLVTTDGARVRMTIVRDVSERNKLAEQLRQSQKMEAVGRLAGGVAHDFNNLLSIVLSYSEMLLNDMDPSNPIADDLLQIRKAGARAADLTRQLLAFSRQQVLQPRVLNLNDVIVGAEKMFRRIIGEDIALTVTLAPNLGSVNADVGQLNQVLLNLVVNARDAMPSGGKLHIETKNVSVAPGTAHPSGVPAGTYAVLVVTDSGTGMDEATRARIFEPFFTTKGPGKGTGLGLATVFGIVQQSSGSVQVASEVGKGASFSVYLPRSDGRAEPIEAPRAAPASRGTETVLLVEDEELVRTLVQGILRRAGYRVLEAPGPGEAILVAEQSREPIDLLLTDLVMPRMNGVQLSQRLVAAYPMMHVLIMSGYSDDRIARNEIRGTNIPFLQKPIMPNTLLAAVRAALDQGREPSSVRNPSPS